MSVCLYVCWCEEEGFCVPATGVGLRALVLTCLRCLQLGGDQGSGASYWVNQGSKGTCCSIHSVLLRVCA